MNKPSKGQLFLSAFAWASIISIILYILGVRQNWIFATVYTFLIGMSLFGNLEDHY